MERKEKGDLSKDVEESPFVLASDPSSCRSCSRQQSKGNRLDPEGRGCTLM